MKEPSLDDAWYQTLRGDWIAKQEFSILLKLFAPKEGQSILDIGCESGYFSRQS